MDKEKFDDFLVNRYIPRKEFYRRRALHHQQLYRLYQWGLIILSFVAASIVTLENFFDVIFLKVIAALLTIIVSLLTTILKTYNFQEKWTFYHKIYNDLENEWDAYQAEVDHYIQEKDKERYFVMRVLAILKETSESAQYTTVPPASLIDK